MYYVKKISDDKFIVDKKGYELSFKTRKEAHNFFLAYGIDADKKENDLIIVWQPPTKEEWQKMLGSENIGEEIEIKTYPISCAKVSEFIKTLNEAYE